MSHKPIVNIDDPRYVKALGHPLRVRILAILEERPASPVELSRLLGSNLGVVSYHVRTLHDLGLLKLSARPSGEAPSSTTTEPRGVLGSRMTRGRAPRRLPSRR